MNDYQKGTLTNRGWHAKLSDSEHRRILDEFPERELPWVVRTIKSVKRIHKNDELICKNCQKDIDYLTNKAPFLMSLVLK